MPRPRSPCLGNHPGRKSARGGNRAHLPSIFLVSASYMPRGVSPVGRVIAPPSCAVMAEATRSAARALRRRSLARSRGSSLRHSHRSPNRIPRVTTCCSSSGVVRVKARLRWPMPSSGIRLPTMIGGALALRVLRRDTDGTDARPALDQLDQLARRRSGARGAAAVWHRGDIVASREVGFARDAVQWSRIRFCTRVRFSQSPWQRSCTPLTWEIWTWMWRSSSLLPEFAETSDPLAGDVLPQLEAFRDRVTLRQLLCHTSGLPENIGRERLMRSTCHPSRPRST